jgi:hypothetical protein
MLDRVYEQIERVIDLTGPALNHLSTQLDGKFPLTAKSTGSILAEGGGTGGLCVP